MPARQRVDDFVAAVRDGRYVQAIEEFYAEDATMQENTGPARIGRDILVQHEKTVLAGLKRMATHQVGPVLVDGDRVVINWVFEMTDFDGAVRRMDELSLQTWRGDRIVEEQFYYDLSQLAVTL